eukprot:5930334-Pleurochrysis_carterae.AAC.2
MANAARLSESHSSATSTQPGPDSPHIEKTGTIAAAQPLGRLAASILLNACVFGLALIIGSRLASESGVITTPSFDPAGFVLRARAKHRRTPRSCSHCVHWRSSCILFAPLPQHSDTEPTRVRALRRALKATSTATPRLSPRPSTTRCAPLWSCSWRLACVRRSLLSCSPRATPTWLSAPTRCTLHTALLRRRCPRASPSTSCGSTSLAVRCTCCNSQRASRSHLCAPSSLATDG